MVRVVIAESESPAKTVREGFSLFGDFSEIIQKNSTVLILFDFQIPEGVPASVNPETLGETISILKEYGVSRVLCLPGIMWGIDSRKALHYLGIDRYLLMKGAEIVDYSDIEMNSTPIPIATISSINNSQNNPPIIQSKVKITINEINALIVISQIRTDPLIILHTAFNLLNHLLHPKDRYKFFQNNNVSEIQINSVDSASNTSSFRDILINQSFFVLEKKKPAVVINDGFYLLDGNGPQIQNSSKSKKTKQMIFSTDIAAAEWITFANYGFSPTESLFTQEAIRRNLIASLNPSINIIKSKNLSTPPIVNSAITDPTLITIKGLKLYLGEMNDGMKYALLQLLYQFHTLLIKDTTNFGEWAILAGKNPPEPETKGSIILFGDDAINTTQNAKFRTKINLKEIITGEKLDRLIYNKQAKIRDKMDKARVKFQILLEDTINTKEDPLDREITTLEENMKLELNLNNLQRQIAEIQINIPYEQKLNELSNQIPKVELNTDIVSIPGNPPLGWDPMIYFYSYWSVYKASILHVFTETARLFIQFPAVNKKITESNWKKLKKELKLQLEAKYAPLKPQIEEQKKTIKLERKQKLLALKEEFTQSKNKIKTQYLEKINPLKQQMKLEKAKIEFDESPDDEFELDLKPASTSENKI